MMMTDDPKTAFDALKALITAEPEYAWAWHCNFAVPIMDVTGVSHKAANATAALIMRQLFDYDITSDQRYEYGKSPAQKYFERRVAAEREEDAAKVADSSQPLPEPPQ